ncbi:MAG: Fe2+ transport protein FeoA [Methanophagales archaeon]|nr:ferrous iron transport protein A [Methanophagales archaeon]MCU4139189.1 Fe2+ transport protein FeoA [Methanophagales archaeon]
MRSRGRIFGIRKLIEHLSEDLEHVHADVERLKASSEEGSTETEEFKRGLEEVDEHLHDLLRHSEELKSAIPLAFLSEGDEAEIVEISGGGGLTQRLTEMGFTPATRVRVLKSSPPGPMLVSVRGSRIALGRGVAMKILVNGIRGSSIASGSSGAGIRKDSSGKWEDF